MSYCSDPSKVHSWKLVFIVVGATSAVRRLVILVERVKTIVVSTSHPQFVPVVLA
jgi:hypothetical protein